MAISLCFAHHFIGFDIVIDDDLIEPIFALGVVMTAFIVSMVVVALVIAGLLGSFFLIGALIALAVGGVVLFTGMLFSWPVLLTIVVIWLICRDKKSDRRAYHRY